MQPIDHLSERLRDQRLVLFLGADLPSQLTGLPSRADLAAAMAARYGLAPGLSLASAAQQLMRGGNRREFTGFLLAQLRASRQPRRVHQLIAAIAPRTIVTTAYDDLLERAFEQRGVAISPVVTAADLAYLSAGRPALIWLYGRLGAHDTMVVTEDDQYGLWRSREKQDLLDEVRAALRQNSALLIGQSLGDPAFLLLWREVLERAGGFAQGAYAVWPGLPADERRVWAERQIQLLDLEPLALLERLARAALPAEHSPPSPTPEQHGTGLE